MADNSSPPQFPLIRCWRDPLRSLAQSMHLMLRARELRAAEIAAIAKLLGALERLPLATDNIGIEASLTVKYNAGWNAQTIQLYSHCLTIGFCRGFDSGHGSDHEIQSVVDLEVSGACNSDASDPISVMNALEDWVAEWVQRINDSEVEFRIFDECRDEMWYEDPSKTDPWEGASDVL